MPAHKKGTVFADKTLRIIVGSAIYADIVLSVEGGVEWRASTLETEIDDVTAGERSGWIHRLYKGSISNDDRLIKTQKILGKHSLLRWKYSPLWTLLQLGENTTTDIESALHLARGKIRCHIWSNMGKNAKPKPINKIRLPITESEIEELSKYESLNSFIVLTALAKEALKNHFFDIHFRLSMRIRELFPSVVCSEPRLFIRWPLLAERYEQILWKHDIYHPSVFLMTIKKIILSMKCLPPK